VNVGPKRESGKHETILMPKLWAEMVLG
jgi:hypothetical protein